MNTKQKFYAIFATAMVAITALMTTGCSKDEEYDLQSYDDEYTLAEPMMTRSTEGGEYLVSTQECTCTVAVYPEIQEDEGDSDGEEEEDDGNINGDALDFLDPNYGTGVSGSNEPGVSITFQYTLKTYSTGRKVGIPSDNLTNEGFRVNGMAHIYGSRFSVSAQGPDGRTYKGQTN